MPEPKGQKTNEETLKMPRRDHKRMRHPQAVGLDRQEEGRGISLCCRLWYCVWLSCRIKSRDADQTAWFQTWL